MPDLEELRFFSSLPLHSGQRGRQNSQGHSFQQPPQHGALLRERHGVPTNPAAGLLWRAQVQQELLQGAPGRQLRQLRQTQRKGRRTPRPAGMSFVVGSLMVVVMMFSRSNSS